MITETTTLILGAGASKLYSFPSGAELRRLLCDHNKIIAAQGGFVGEDVVKFSQTFLNSGMRSIDAFLARRGGHAISSNGTTYADVGKAAIAYCLIQREVPEVFNIFPEDHWYEYLWSFMSDSLESFGENKLRIITFNYDRSLEYYLLTRLQHSFGISLQEAAIHLRKIPILHVYGQLAEIPELADSKVDSRFYAPNMSDPAHLAVAARSIRVIAESRDDDKIFEKAYSYMNDAKKICFLGFGFDEINMRRLRIDSLMAEFRSLGSGAPRIYATTLGLEDAERSAIVSRLSPSRHDFERTRSRIASHGHLKIEQYLRATGVFFL